MKREPHTREKLLGSKSSDAAFQAQPEYLGGSYEKALGQPARFGELRLDFVKETTKPFEDVISATKK